MYVGLADDIDEVAAKSLRAICYVQVFLICYYNLKFQYEVPCPTDNQDVMNPDALALILC